MSWTVKGKDKRNWYVTVSGGYVIFGQWLAGEPLSAKDTYCNMEQFIAGHFHAEIKEVRFFFFFVFDFRYLAVDKFINDHFV